MKIDVTISTKNNAKTIGRVIESVRAHLPYNRIILIDDSNDTTPEIARNLGASVYRVEGKLGVKRTMQAKLAQTEWIASIDSDIFVYENWWPEMSKYIGLPMVTSIHGYLESAFKDFFQSYEHYTKFCAQFRTTLTRRSGMIGNSLIKKDALLLCEQDLAHVHAGEDTVIGRVLKNKGHRFIEVRIPVGFHHHDDPIAHHMMAYHRAGQSTKSNQGALVSPLSITRFMLLQGVQLGLFSFAERKFDPQLIRFMIHMSLLYYAGIRNKTTLQTAVEEAVRKAYR